MRIPVRILACGLAAAGSVGNSGRAGALDSACQSLMDAQIKAVKMPYRAHATIRPGLPGSRSESGKSPGVNMPTEEDIVFTGAAMYIRIRGKDWRKVPETAEENVDEIRRKAQTSKATCARAGDESVDGEAAAVYSEHDVTESGTADSKSWISRSRGLPLRMDVTTPKGTTTIRYEYGNVQPPPGVSPK
jgi:hypothetical protein